MTWPLCWRKNLLYWKEAADARAAENRLLRTAIRDANAEMHKQKRLLADIIDYRTRSATLARMGVGGATTDGGMFPIGDHETMVLSIARDIHFKGMKREAVMFGGGPEEYEKFSRRLTYLLANPDKITKGIQ